MNITLLNPLSDFKYWFSKKDRNSYNVFKIVGTSSLEVLDKVTLRVSSAEDDSVIICDESLLISADEIRTDFSRWITRPEACAGRPIKDIPGMSLDALRSAYENILIGCYIQSEIEAGKYTPNTYRKCEAMIEWLESTDFFVAPASTQYHESFAGGLLVHSLNVYNNIVELVKVNKFSSVSYASAGFIALVHDWCKIGLYERYSRNVKNDKGVWESVDAYRHNQTSIPLGHGVTSMFYAGKFKNLSSNEALAIRWHQGRWNVCREEMNEFQKANESCPEVHLLQFADQLAITSF